jgi:pimeloyl-ACP methyl ester carboxylesterase
MLMALGGRVEARALVSIDMAPRRYQPSHTAMISSMKSLPLESIRSRREADEYMAEAVPAAAVRSFLLKNLVRDEAGFQWRLNIDAIEADYDRLLGWEPPQSTFRGPALFIGGDRSTYFRIERDREDILRWFPDARLEVIADAGHWLHADKPDELLAHLRSFLGELELEHT